jgi:ABC-type transport system involved in cytochrome c biogenesis permease subunit
MELKLSVQSLLLYAAMVAYLLALGAWLVGRRRAGVRLYGVGFTAALAAVAWRWWTVGHLPLQSMFEVFLFLGMLVFPLSLLCRRALGVGGEAADMVIGLLLLFPAGFVFSDQPQQLPPALRYWMFAPHVVAYLTAYVLMAKACAMAVAELAGHGRHPPEGLVTSEEATHRLICLGFPLMTGGLVLGAFWGKAAWGNWWNWDPKELWGLATWLVYVLYLHTRSAYGGRHRIINSAIAVAGTVFIVITLLWVNLSRLFAGLHGYAA